MNSAQAEVVAGLIADTVSLHHQQEAIRGLVLALARVVIQNVSVPSSTVMGAMEEASAYLTATGRAEAAMLMTLLSNDVRAFACREEACSASMLASTRLEH